MLEDFILISILITESYSLKKCYHKKCEITQDYFTECDQENYNCTRWNETVGGSNGHCRYWGSSSLNSYVYCYFTDACSSDLVTGQAVCEPNTTSAAVHDMECTERSTIDVLGSIGSWFVVVGGALFLLSAPLGIVTKVCFDWHSRRVQRQDSLQKPLIEDVEVKSISTQTRLQGVQRQYSIRKPHIKNVEARQTAFPVTQPSTASYPPAQIEYASQTPSSPPPSYTAAEFYPAVPFPAAQDPGGNTDNTPEHPGTQYHTGAQIVQPSVQEPLVLTSSPKNTTAEMAQGKIKKIPAKKISTQTTPKNCPSASDGR